MKTNQFFYLLLFCCSFNGRAQSVLIDTTALPYLQKAEFSVLGFGANYEIPVSKVLSLDSGLGFSSGGQVINNTMKFKKSFLNPAFYFKTELKYYYNRYVRVAKKLPTRNGEGSYFAFQNKLLTPRLFDTKETLSTILMTEVHWGIQRNVYQDFLLNLHVGVGRAHDFTTKGSSYYTSVGVKVSYIFATNKITKSSFDKFRF